MRVRVKKSWLTENPEARYAPKASKRVFSIVIMQALLGFGRVAFNTEPFSESEELFLDCSRVPGRSR